jgi:hypothetical protein
MDVREFVGVFVFFEIIEGVTEGQVVRVLVAVTSLSV